MKSIRQLDSLLFWGIALIVITLFNSCGPHLAPEMVPLFVYGDSLKKVTISYYDMENKKETVSLPFFKTVYKSHEAPSSDKFYVTVCDTSLTYRGFISNFVVGDSCDANSIIA